MSRRAMPWFKLYGSLLDEEEYWMMPLEQRAVYVDLLMLAAKSNPRGSFNAEDMDRLARRVADGRRDVLEATLSYCTTQWLTEDGTPTITVTDGRGYFTKWKTLQQPPSTITGDSDDEAVVNSEDKRSENEEINSGFVPELCTTRGKREEGRSKRVEVRGIDGKNGEAEAPTAPANLSPISDVLRILRLIEGASIRDDAVSRERIQTGLDEYPQLNPSAVGLDYAAWQNDAKPNKRHKDVIRGFLNQMRMRAERGDPRYLVRDPVVAESWSPPTEDELAPCNTQEWREARVLVSERMRGNYPMYFGAAADQIRDGRLVLTFPDAYERDWAQQRYGGIVADALADCGREMEVEYAVLGQEMRAAG